MSEPFDIASRTQVPFTAETVAGEAIATPPSVAQQRLCHALTDVLSSHIDPGFAPVMSAGWRVRREPLIIRAPGVMVIPSTRWDGELFTQVPLLAVEVVSIGNMIEVTRKSAEYAAAGLPRLWVIQPGVSSLTALRLYDDVFWRIETMLTSRHPLGVLDTGAGEIPINIQGLCDL